MRVHVACVRRAEAPRRKDGQRRRGGFGLGGARFGQDGLARHPLLQEQLGRLDPRVGVEPRDERVLPHDVGERDERHALVMREVRAHRDRPLLRRGWRVRFDIAIAGVVVERLVEPVARVEAGLGQRLEILAAAAGDTRLARADAYGAMTRSVPGRASGQGQARRRRDTDNCPRDR